MKVRMKTLAAGPLFVLQAGQEVNLEKDLAEMLIETGYAEEVVLSKVERATADPKAKATASAQKEKPRSKPKSKAKPIEEVKGEE